MEQSKSTRFPADLFALLVPPAYVIFAVLFGPQRTWLFLLLLGLGQLAASVSLLRHSKSLTGWVSLAIGIMFSAVAIISAFFRGDAKTSKH
jgi:hypothetical protein